MMKRLAVVAAMLALSGCIKEEFQRIDGMTPGAGNAIAANTAMQMVDPWPVGVDDTELSVPADRTPYKVGAAASGPQAAGGAATAGTSKNN